MGIMRQRSPKGRGLRNGCLPHLTLRFAGLRTLRQSYSWQGLECSERRRNAIGITLGAHIRIPVLPLPSILHAPKDYCNFVIMAKDFLLYFLPVWFVGVVLMAILVLFYGYDQSFLVLNGMRMPYTQNLMLLLSWIGNGGVAGFITWLLLRKKSATVLLIAILSLVISGLLSQLGKQVFFSDWHRPLFYFEGKETIYFLPDQAFQFNSFPSGHATTAAALGFLLAYFAGSNPLFAIGFALLSIGIGYSRVYIGVHFPGDVLAGWLLGATVTLVLIRIAMPVIDKILTRSPKLSTGIHLFLSFGVVGALIYEFSRFFFF